MYLVLVKLLLVDLLLVGGGGSVLRWTMRNVIKSVVVTLVQRNESSGRHSQRVYAKGGAVTRRTGGSVMLLARVEEHRSAVMQGKAMGAVNERGVDVL